MNKIDLIKGYSKKLSLHHTNINIDEILEKSQLKNISYVDFLLEVLKSEMDLKDEKALLKRIKNAGFPVIKEIQNFDLKFQNSISHQQINNLISMNWVDQMFNLIFLGPPGVGKTHISIALGYEAVKMGYKVSFTTMDKLMHVLKTEQISRYSKGKINKILSSSLVIIDEIGYLPITREDANLFFQLISTLHEQASIIITSNKGLEDWSELLGDPALTTAVLDRLTYKCELFNMTGKSYRLENRKSLF
jgi:DNA replication protein DnaC